MNQLSGQDARRVNCTATITLDYMTVQGSKQPLVHYNIVLNILHCLRYISIVINDVSGIGSTPVFRWFAVILLTMYFLIPDSRVIRWAGIAQSV